MKNKFKNYDVKKLGEDSSVSVYEKVVGRGIFRESR